MPRLRRCLPILLVIASAAAPGCSLAVDFDRSLLVDAGSDGSDGGAGGAPLEELVDAAADAN